MPWSLNDETQFFTNIYPAVKRLADRTGVSPVFILAQIMQETGWGGSVISGTNNLFNIKADSSWNGSYVTAPTIEYVNNKPINTMAKFRVYTGYDASLTDWWNFLTSNPRYQAALQPDIMANPIRFAQALQAAGFATDPNYAANIVRVGGSPIFTTTLNSLLPPNTIDSTEWQLVHNRDSATGGSNFVPNAVTQAAYDQVRQNNLQPWNNQTFSIGANGDSVTMILLSSSGAYPYGPPQGATSSNCEAVWIGVGGPDAEAMIEAIQAAGVPLAPQYPGTLGIPNTTLSVNTANYPGGNTAADAQGAIDWGSQLLATAESAAAAAQGIASPGDTVDAYPAYFPGTHVLLPPTVTDAAANSNWASIASSVAQQLATTTGFASGGTTAPAVVVNVTGQQSATGGWPYLDPGWVASGDAVALSDPSTMRLQTADAPGETVVSFAPNSTVDGRSGNDTVWAGSGNDTLIGGPQDTLHGGDGNDSFVLSSNDTVYAGPGTNVFDVGSGSGQTAIYAGGGGTDTVQLASGIAPSEFRVVPRGWTDDLTLQIGSSSDVITLKDWYETDASLGPTAGDPFLEHPERGTRVEQIVFSDGTVWDASTLRAKSLVADGAQETIVGFDTNDTLNGTAGNDELWAGSGNDTLLGGPNDVLHGGSGTDIFVAGSNNTMYGGGGVSTFEFAPGDGKGTIAANGGTNTVQFAAGIRPQDIVATRDANNNLVLSIANTTDQVLVSDYFDPSDSSHQIQQVTFADGTVWNQTAIAQQVQLNTPPSFVGQSSLGYGGQQYGSFGVQVIVPQGTRSGDLLLDFVEFSSPVSFAPGAGFSVLGSVNNKLYAFSKVATNADTPGTAETFDTWLTGPNSYGSVAADYRGAGSPTVQATQAGGPLVMTVGVPTAGNPAVVNYLQAYGVDAGTPYTATLPAGDALIAEQHATNVPSSFTGGDLALASENTGATNAPPPTLNASSRIGYSDQRNDFGIQVIVPQGTQPGDLLVDFIEFSQAVSGFTPGTGFSVLGDVNDKLYAVYKTATSADTPGLAETFSTGLWAGESYGSVAADYRGATLPTVQATQTSGPLAMTVAVPGTGALGVMDLLTAYGVDTALPYTGTLPSNQTLVAEQHATNVPSSFNGADLTLGRESVAGTSDAVQLWMGTPPLDVTFNLQPNGGQGDTLQIFQHGSATPITVANWDNADGSPGPHGTLETSDGSTLLHSNVASLIQAIAAYTTQNGLTWDQAIDQKPADVQAILAQYWQPPQH